MLETFSHLRGSNLIHCFYHVTCIEENGHRLYPCIYLNRMTNLLLLLFFRFLLFYFSHLAVILELFLEMLIPQSLKTLVNRPTYQIGQVVSMVRQVYHLPGMFLLMVFQSRSNIVIHVCSTVHQGAPIAQSATTV